METAVIRDKFVDKINHLELFQDKIFNSINSLICNNDEKSISYVEQGKSMIERWRSELEHFKEGIETSDSLQSGQYQEMLSVIATVENSASTSAGGIHAPFLVPPSLKSLETALEKSVAENNKIVSGRLESAIKLFQSIIKNTREVCNQQWLITESACDTQQVMLELLLKMFYRDLNAMSSTLKHFHDNKLSVDAKKFQKYANHQRDLAMQYQAESYKEMCKSIKSQSAIFKSMMSCLNEEFENIPIKDRNKGKKKLDELYKRNQELLIQAEIYYEASHSVILAQSPSTLFYKLIRQWLKDFQSLLIENLSTILLRGSSSVDMSTDLSKSMVSKSMEIRSMETGPSISETKINEMLHRSALYNYAKRLDAGRLIDIASSTNFAQPSTELVNEILLGFTQFHLNSNKQNLERLRKSIDRMFIDYETLKMNVEHMVKTQQKFYTSKESKLPDITGTSGVKGTPGPGVIKQILKLDKDLKVSESKLHSMYNTLFNDLGKEYALLESQNSRLTEIVEYLKQYGLIMREWEEKIKQEQLFIQKWKDVRRYNSQHIANQFIEWKYFLYGEVDVFHSTVGIYSVNIFHKIKESTNDFLAQVMSVFNKRLGDFESETNLISTLYRDIRTENESYGDVLAKVQSEFELWVKDIVFLYQVYFEHRLNTVLMYYVNALETLLQKFTEETSDLQVLILMLDNISLLCRESKIEQDDENRKEEKKVQFLMERF